MEEKGDGLTTGKEHGAEIGRDEIIPLVNAHILQHTNMGNGRIVDQCADLSFCLRKTEE